MAECTFCEGSGDCNLCGGTGNAKEYIAHPDPFHVNPETGDVECPGCDGSGQCENCEGSGEEDDE
jgi:DnaJ-class molecular chaperone